MKQHLLRPSLFMLLLLACAGAMIVSPAKQLLASSATKRAAAAEAAQRLPEDLWRRTELYFGSAKPDGTVVTEEQFQRFIDQEVTPRFPDGLTLLTGYGQFRNSAGVIIKERSAELILLYPLNQRDAHRKIEEIRENYKRAFQQESVLRVDSVATVSF
jgi:hypothetical protein